jgi:hypothetical protein
MWTMASVAGEPTPQVQLEGLATAPWSDRAPRLRIFEDGALEWDDGLGPAEMATLTTRERQLLRASIDATDFTRLELDPHVEPPAGAVRGSFLTPTGVRTVPLWQLRGRLELWSLVMSLKEAHPLRVRARQPALKLTVETVTSQLPQEANTSLREALRARVKALRQCIDRDVITQRTKGSLELGFNVTARGQVTGAISVSSSVNSEPLHACVRTLVRSWVLGAFASRVRVVLSFFVAHSSPQEVSTSVAALREETRRCADPRGFRFTLLPDGRATEVVVPGATPETVDCVERVVLDWDSPLAVHAPSLLTVPPASGPR